MVYREVQIHLRVEQGDYLVVEERNKPKLDVNIVLSVINNGALSQHFLSLQRTLFCLRYCYQARAERGLFTN